MTTLWRVAYGELHRGRRRRRWAPRPPKQDPGLTAEERRARRERWYAEVYWPWKLAVVEEIRRAPQAAAALFERLVPERERPDAWLSALLEGRPTREELDQVERQIEDEHPDRLRAVAALAAAGLPTGTSPGPCASPRGPRGSGHGAARSCGRRRAARRP